MITVEQLSLAIRKAYEWHSGVVYGGGMVMTDQLNGTASAIDRLYKGKDKTEVLVTALLSKAWETKRHNAETQNNPNAGNSYEDLMKVFGPTVANNIRAMAGEPDSKDWHEMAAWAKKQNPQVQAVLLAEKLQNFIVSRDRPNPKKEPAWHINYYQTRMIMVDAIKEACPELHAECVKVAAQGIEAQRRKLAEMGKGAEPTVVVSAEKGYTSDRTNGRV